MKSKIKTRIFATFEFIAFFAIAGLAKFAARKFGWVDSPTPLAAEMYWMCFGAVMWIAFRWFQKDHGLYARIGRFNDDMRDNGQPTYSELRDEVEALRRERRGA